MNRVRSILTFVISSILGIILIGGYLFGMYSLIASDSRTTKELIVGMAIPPYTIYVGVIDGYDALVGNRADHPTVKEKIPLVEFVVKLNDRAKTPVMMDEATELISLSVDENNIVYTFRTVDKESTEDLKTIFKGMIVTMRLQYCENEGYNEYTTYIIEENVGTNLIYLDKNYVEIERINMNKSSCEK